jgi:hypothetical protein
MSDTWEWNGVNWTNMVTQVTPGPLRRHSMVYDSRRKVVVLFGGYGNSTLYDDEWELPSGSTQWTQIISNPRPSARYNHAMAYDLARSRGDQLIVGRLTLGGDSENVLGEIGLRFRCRILGGHSRHDFIKRIPHRLDELGV